MVNTILTNISCPEKLPNNTINLSKLKDATAALEFLFTGMSSYYKP